MDRLDVVVIGAGPIGIELGAALGRAGLSGRLLDAGQVGETIFRFPPLTRWFSSNDRIAIAGVPLQTPDQSRCRREEYLAYLRAVVLQFDLDVRTYERAEAIEREDGGFRVRTVDRTGRPAEHAARRVVIATGGTARARRLGVPGGDLPHVHDRLDDPHRFFRRRVLVIGGRNSAVEAALRCHHAGACVTISYRGAAFPERVKYWLRPEIEMLIKTGAITCHYGTVPIRIEPDLVELAPVPGGNAIEVQVNEVLALIGYDADMTMFERAGVRLEGSDRCPAHDPTTMETNIPGVFVAGTAVAGTQSTYRVFLENCHVHVDRILAAIEGRPGPAAPPEIGMEEA